MADAKSKKALMPKVIIATVVACVLFIVSSILFGLAFQDVSPTQVGLDFDQQTRMVDHSIIYPGGRYFLGLGHEFILFPTKYEAIDFSSDPDAEGGPALRAFASSGQTITLEVSFFYRLDEMHVTDLYKTAATNYLPLFIKKGEEVLKNVASQFTVEAFFEHREDIAARMREVLNLEFRKHYKAWVPLLQLRDIEVPASLENSLIANVVAQQNTQRELLNREIHFIRQQTAILEAENQAEINEILQEARSNATVIENLAVSEGNRMIALAEAEAYQQLMNAPTDDPPGLGLTAEQVINYLWLQNLADSNKDETWMVDVSGSTIVKTP